MEKYYRLLGLSPGVSRAEIKSAARKLLLEHHPDLNPGRRESCEELTKQLIEAYREVMSVAADQPVAPSHDRGAAPHDETGEFECIVFTLNNRSFALPTQGLREVIRIKDVRIEEASIISDMFPWLVGLFHRGSDVAVLWNLHGQLGLREPTMDSGFVRSKIVVVSVNDSPAGFIVDDISGISVFRTGEVADPGEEAADFNPAYIDGRIDSDGEATLLLNLGNLVYNFTA